METITSSSWLSFPDMNMITTTTDTSLNHELAIRRFCPAARIEELERYDQEDHTEPSYSPCDQYHVTTSTTNSNTNTSPPPHLDLAASEVDELVDSFINVDDDHYHEEDDDNNNKLLEDCGSIENHPNFFHHFQDDDTFFNDVLVDVDVPMNVQVQVVDDDQFEIGGPFVEDDANNNMGIAADDGVPTNGDHGGFQAETHDGIVDQGLHLVHLLLACAEAVGCRDTQLADSVLSQIWAFVNPWGDSLHRVSYCFAAGLKSRLSLLHHVNADDTFINGGAGASLISREEKLEAFQLFYQTTPYIAFGFLAANEAIYQAAQGKHCLHVIDLGMEHTLQWPSLIRALSSRPEGPPTLRITGLINDQHNILELDASMRALAQDANSFGILLEFDVISESVTPGLFTREKLDLREGEALYVNSIMNLHKFVKESRGSLKAILQAIKKLGPTLLTVVEQDANHNGPFFLGRFLESLHYYSAIFDSLEVSLPRNSLQRVKIEKLHLAEEIRNIVAYEGTDRIERHERADQWRRQLGRAGFQVMGLKCMSQARMMLSVYGCDGYTLASEKGCLLLGWKGRPIMLASAWQVHNVSSS